MYSHMKCLTELNRLTSGSISYSVLSPLCAAQSMQSSNKANQWHESRHKDADVFISMEKR